MRTQTYITKLLDNNNKTIEFERWSYKRIETVERKIKELYTSYDYVYKKYIEKSTYIVINEASDNENQKEVRRYLIKEFLQQ